MKIENAFVELEEILRFKLNNDNSSHFTINELIEQVELEKQSFSDDYFNYTLKLLSFQERPELEWISKATILFFHSTNYPINLISILLQSCTYFGFHEIISNILVKIPPNLPFEHQCDIYKHHAKYLKNIGDLKKAQAIYRKAIIYSDQNKREDYTAFFIMLYAKLCQDHLQRVGIYVAFHDIAYKRLQKCLKQDNIFSIKRNKLNLWINISKDAYAKAIYTNSPKKADKIFSSISIEDLSNNERKYRIKFRQLECKINYILEDEKKYKKIPKLISDYFDCISAFEIQGNIKAIYIRNIRFVRLLRKIKEKSNSILINSNLYDVALNKAKEAKTDALMLSDTKMAAEALIEIALWEKIQVTESNSQWNNNEQLYNNIIKYLLEAENILTNNRESVITSTYFDIINTLAINFLELGNWDKSLFYYEKLYDYVGVLVKSVTNDEKEIVAALNSKKTNKNLDTNLLPEFQVLSKPELIKLKEKIVVDYKLLLDKLSDYKEKIRQLSEKRLHFHQEKIRLTHKSFSHDLVTIANNMESIINGMDNDEHNLSDLKNKILFENRQIVSKCTEWEKSMESLYELSLFDINIFLNKYIEFDYFKNRGIITFRVENYKFNNPLINFNESILRGILDNLVNNIIQVGKRLNVTNIEIGFGISEDTHYEYLCIDDNVGDYDFFKSNIDSLNFTGKEIQKIASRRSPTEGGRGLSYVRNNIFVLTQIVAPWELLQIKDNIKILKIPFQIKKNE